MNLSILNNGAVDFIKLICGALSSSKIYGVISNFHLQEYILEKHARMKKERGREYIQQKVDIFDIFQSKYQMNIKGIFWVSGTHCVYVYESVCSCL